MRDNLNDWREIPTEFDEVEIHEWNRRVEITREMVDSFIEGMGRSNDQDEWAQASIFAYQYPYLAKQGTASTPVGVMVLDLKPNDARMIPTIEGLVTHPGSERAGGALMQLAVQESANAGRGGRITLTATDDAAITAYAAWGFEGPHDLELTMSLDPETRPDKWIKHDGKWCLTSRLSEKQDATFSQRPPAYTAPIEELTVEQAKAAISAMRNNLDGWLDYPEEYLEREEITTPDEAQQDAWYGRILTTETMLDDLNDTPSSQLDDRKIFAYQYQHPHTGEKYPAGLVIVNTSLGTKPPCISDLVTHPGSQKAGGALIERAVEASDQAGKGGQLSLHAVDDAAEAVYAVWGFTKSDNTRRMELDPAKSDKWVRQDNEWHLKSRLNEKLAATSSTHA